MLVVICRLSVTLVFAATLFGCASTGQFPGAATEGVPGGIVKSTGGTAGSFFSGLSPLGTSKDVRIFRVNGVKVNGMGATSLVRLAPGTQQIEASCSFTIEGRLIQGNGSISVNVVDGHIYQLDAKPPCVVSVSDITAR